MVERLRENCEPLQFSDVLFHHLCPMENHQNDLDALLAKLPIFAEKHVCVDILIWGFTFMKYTVFCWAPGRISVPKVSDVGRGGSEERNHPLGLVDPADNAVT